MEKLQPGRGFDDKAAQADFHLVELLTVETEHFTRQIFR